MAVAETSLVSTASTLAIGPAHSLMQNVEGERSIDITNAWNYASIWFGA